MLAQNFFVHPWKIIKSFQVRLGNKFQQIAISLHIAREQNQMGDHASFPFSLETTALGNDIGFTADQGFDTKRSGGLIKIDGAEEIPMVGHP